jgi:hypothetical protein
VTEFKPLDFGRVLDGDDSLDVYEYAVLNAMARGVDNQTFKVRRSLSAIAKAAKIKKHQTVSEILCRPHVAKYVSRIERHPRRVDIWLQQEPLVRGADKATGPNDLLAEESLVRGTDKPCTPDGQDMAVGRTPSALSAPSAQQENDPVTDPSSAPCFNCGLHPCECSTEVEVCEFHPQIAVPCSYCSQRVRLEALAAKQPDFKRQGWHESHNESEGLASDGDGPLGESTAPRYRGRQRS